MQDDPADLGTAFGLEMSLGEAAADAARDAPSAAPAQVAGARRQGLVQRLTGRRKTSD
jgi:hypothetical protein